MRSIKRASALAGLGLAVLSVVLPLTANATNKYKVLHNFGEPQDGLVPAGALLLEQNGGLYGVTGGGPGVYGNGTVFELLPQANGTWKESILHSFTAGSGGAFPEGSLLLDSAGNLYGTIRGDGSFAIGGVFELSPGLDGWGYTVIYGDNAGPGLVFDKLGNLFGEIGPGDYFGIGAIGELSPASGGWTYTALFDFNPTVGYLPPAPPIWDDKGNLFGTTTYGGITQPACQTAFGCGVVFEMTPNRNGTWTTHFLHRFASYPTDGQIPSGGMVLGPSGELYGVTVYGGAYGNGRVFRMSRSSGGHWEETAIYDFPHCALGCLPGSTMVFDAAGNLYGVASGGKVDCDGYTCGVVFKLTPQKNGSWSYSVVHAFDGTHGSSPAGVIVDDKGEIFGTTSTGGSYNFGVAFEITP